jgi:hypothetical protein
MAFYESINSAPSPDQLDNIFRTVSTYWGNSALSDDEATFLFTAIDGRRPMSARRIENRRCAVTGFGASAESAVSIQDANLHLAARRPAPRLGSRFTPRQRPRSPDREASRNRRRKLGGSSVLPDTLRHHYTEGQRAVLCIVAGEIKHHGVCDLPIDKIAALAGVCRTTVQTTLHEARRLNHIRITERPVPGRKHLPNLIEIASAEWRTWLKRGPSAHRPIGSKTVNLESTTKNTDLQKEGFAQAERPQGAIQRVPWATAAPLSHVRRKGLA